MISAMVRRFKVDRIIVAYDCADKPWRFNYLPSYKGGFHPRNPQSELGTQLRAMPAHLAGFGIPSIQVPSLEADDILALLCEHPDLKQSHRILYSKDKDLLAYVGKQTYYQSPSAKGLVQEDNFQEYVQTACKFKHPMNKDWWPLFRAMTGDPSDEVKGLSNCGAAYASQMINELVKNGAKFTGYNQPWDEIEPQIVALKDKLPPHLQKLLSPQGLTELKDAYQVVRVANAPEAAKAILSKNPLPQCPPVSADAIKEKLTALGFKEWVDQPAWHQLFAKEPTELHM
jgi:5'-3' exonuclease